MRRVRVTFWSLVALAIFSVGAISIIASARPGPGLGALLVVLALVALGATVLAARILIVLSRLRSQKRAG